MIMQKKNSLTIPAYFIFTVLTIVGISIILFQNYNSNANNESLLVENSQSEDENFRDEPKRNERISIGGWIPQWASKSGLDTLRRYDFWTGMSPVWYELNDDATLAPMLPENYKELLAYARSNNIEVIPSIANFDHVLFSKVVENEQKLETHIEMIINEVDFYDFAGIDLDYEAIALKDREAYFKILESLSNQLRSRGKKLSVTVLSKWGDDVKYGYYPETREVQDWTRIAKYADEVRVMAYDFTSQTATYPGPIAPMDWFIEVLDYALTKVPKEKLVMAVHTYAYEWYATSSVDSESLLAFEPNGLANTYSGNRNSRAYTFETISVIHQKYLDGNLVDFQSEMIYRYQAPKSSGGIENRVVVYIDQEGISERAELAKNHGIKGIYFWRLGNDSDLYSHL